MEQPVTNETGWRGSPDLWLEAAYDALIESGVEAVRILPLAKRLDLSRTSFYWFFKDREELLDALVSRWRDKNTGALLKQTEAYAETLEEAVLNVFDCWLDRDIFDPAFEFAVRRWKRKCAPPMQVVWPVWRACSSGSVLSLWLPMFAPARFIWCRSVISRCARRKTPRCDWRAFRIMWRPSPARPRCKKRWIAFWRATLRPGKVS